MADVGALTPIAMLGALYAIGLTRSDRSRIGGTRMVAGAAGVATLALALGPPLDGWTATDLAAHMIQHVALLAIAPPLLIVGMLPTILLNAAPPSARDRVACASGALRRVPPIVWTMAAIGAQTTALGIWHVPAIYDAAAANPALHALEHLSFLATGFAFWWAVAGAGRRSSTGAAVIAIFVASLPGTLLGALMTLSTSPWYPRYATGAFARALQNQQLAGVVMWAGGGMAYVAAGATFFVVWLRDLERASPSRVRLESVS